MSALDDREALRKAQKDMREEAAESDGVDAEWWTTFAALVGMMADHADGRGNSCPSCIGQAADLARAYLGQP